MSVLNIVLILLLGVTYSFGLYRGRKLGYNDCLRVNRSAFQTEAERAERQRELVRKAFTVGKIAGRKEIESNRQSND